MDEGQRWAREGESHFAAGRYAQAVQAFSQAEAWFAEHDRPVQAAEMRANRGVALLQQGEAQAAYEVLRDLPAFFAQHDDTRRAGLAWGNLAAALEALGRRDEAVEAYRTAWRLLEEAGDGDAVAYVAQALSRLQLQAKRPLDALVTYDQGLAASSRRLHQLVRRLLRAPFRLSGR